jgi:rfaE bifunctional protein kinase chain/domain
MQPLLSPARLDEILAKLPQIKIAVIGDFFLDNYWILEESLNEISLETGKVAYQVVAKRKSPGAAGTVASVLRSLDVNVLAVGFSGDDGMGYDLRAAMSERGINLDHFITVKECFTPTYTKPMLRTAGEEEELNRIDIKNRQPISAALEDQIITAIDTVMPQVDALIILDQVVERNCGVVTDRVRSHLADMSTSQPEKIILADSRAHIGEFRKLGIKVNNFEARQIVNSQDIPLQDVARQLYQASGRPVIITQGAKGILVCDQHGWFEIPTIKIEGPIDVVGAGDSVTASMTAALCAGATLQEAALIGNITASLIVQQIGTTGTATRAEVRERFCQKFI